MPSAQYNAALYSGSTSISAAATRSDVTAVVHEYPLQLGCAGTMTASNQATLAGGHTIVNGTGVDVYWATGHRVNVTANVSGNVVTLSGGDGDALPATTTAVVVSTQEILETEIDGDNLALIGYQFVSANALETAECHVLFGDVSGTNGPVDDVVMDTGAATIADIAGGVANNLSGNVVEMLILSSGSATAVATFKLIALQH